MIGRLAPVAKPLTEIPGVSRSASAMLAPPARDLLGIDVDGDRGRFVGGVAKGRGRHHDRRGGRPGVNRHIGARISRRRAVGQGKAGNSGAATTTASDAQPRIKIERIKKSPP
jgi:hypothetical protein